MCVFLEDVKIHQHYTRTENKYPTPISFNNLRLREIKRSIFIIAIIIYSAVKK